MKKKILTLLLLPLALAGCAPLTTITNLTPTRLDRESSGFYRIEAAWQTHEATILPGTIKPAVVVGTDTYEMKPELVVSGRWETFVPVPATDNLIHYYFKFDFFRDEIPRPIEDSKLSPDYSLQIVDKTAGK